MRPTPWHHRLSLKAKLSALSMAITLLIVVLMTSLTLVVQQQDVQRSVSTAQRTLLEGMAMDLDMELEARREALTLQASVLTMLMNPGKLRRVYDNEAYTPADQDAVTLPEIMNTIGDAAWSELDKGVNQKYTARKPMISALRRALQREHAERLIDLTIDSG